MLKIVNKRTVTAGLAALVLATGIVAQTSAPANAYIIYPYPYHHHHNNWGGPLAAGAAGFMLGAAMSGAAAAPAPAPSYDSLHVRRCMGRYRSYDPGTDTFIGFDGRPHYCNL